VAYGVRESVKGTFKSSYYARSLAEDGVFRTIWPNAHPSLESGEGTASFTDLVDFQWAKDGSHNLMVALHKSKAEEVLVESLKVRVGGDGNQNAPAVAPDGTRAVLVSEDAGGTNLWIVDLVDGATPLQLTFTADAEGNPSWHPKDAKILYESRNRLGSDIQLFDLDTFASTPIFRNGVSDEVVPTYSPDGKRFAFLSNKDAPDGLSWDLFVMEPGAPLPTKVIPRVRRTEHGPGYSWDPLGRYVFAVQDDSKAGHPLMLAPADGSTPARVLPTQTKDNTDPTTIGDGTGFRLAFSALDIPKEGVTPWRVVYVADLDVGSLAALGGGAKP
jgi:Tol biopolymer transport system component